MIQNNQSDESRTTDYLPARMVNEFVYCPRLFYLMHIESQFAETVETIDGQIVHRRVDTGSGGLPMPQPGNIPLADSDDPETMYFVDHAPRQLPVRKSRHTQPATLFADPSESTCPPMAAGDSADSPSDADETIHARTVMLSSDELGVIAKLDLVEATGNEATPVDYKRGKPLRRPDGSIDAWPPEKIQLCLQALILRENGFRCQTGVLYFNATRQRLVIPIDAALIDQTKKAVNGARDLQDLPILPPPLVESAKCAKCALAQICLPDESRKLIAIKNPNALPLVIRPLVTARDERRPLYLNSQGAWVGKKDEVLQVKLEGRVIQEVRLREINQINLFGNVQLSTQAIQTCLDMDIPVVYFSQRGWFYGITHALGVKNILTRREQFRRADNSEFCLTIAQSVVRSKIRNCRTLLMRNHVSPPPDTISELKRIASRVDRAESLASLLGWEGTAARLYFQAFGGMLKVNCDLETAPGSATNERRLSFDFRGRNRRPPRDPVNALLSLAYSLLTKDCLIALTNVGLDPYLGFYHQVKPGKPALALDLMESFRPLIADSTVITAINNRMVTPEDFLVAGQTVLLGKAGRKRFLMAYEQRMDGLVTHPLFDYRVSYRRVLEIQARLLSRVLLGEIQEPPEFVTR